MLQHFVLASAVLASPPNGRQIVQAMHDRYAGKWYRTLTFVQKNTATRSDSTAHSVWREYAALPGKLRIEFVPADSGNGVLFANDSQFVFAADTIASASAFIHPLMVLGFDVYFDPAERTAARLERLKFDLATVHEDTWQGRPVRSEEHTSELQSLAYLVCRLLLEKKKKINDNHVPGEQE